jgi:hypothetical protein
MDVLTRIPGWNLLIPLIAIAVSASVHLARDRTRDRARTLEIVLLYSIGIVGFNGAVGFLVHTIWADAAAESIGWAAGSPFQQEVAGANLAIGLIGFLGFWRRDFWLPFLIAKLIFGWTAGAVHVGDLISTGNLAPNNAGPILAWDFLLPVALIWMYAAMRRARGPELPNAMPIRPLAGVARAAEDASV